MLNTKDVNMLRGMFEEILNARLDAKVPRMIEERLEANHHILKRDIRDEMHALIKASEAGIIRRIDVMEERLHKDLEEFIDDNYSPRMYDAEQQILKISGSLKLA